MTLLDGELILLEILFRYFEACLDTPKDCFFLVAFDKQKYLIIIHLKVGISGAYILNTFSTSVKGVVFTFYQGLLLYLGVAPSYHISKDPIPYKVECWHFYHFQDVLYGTQFGPRVYPTESMIIALVRPLVRQSVFKYLGDRSLFFLIFCMKLGHHKGTKQIEPNF